MIEKRAEYISGDYDYPIFSIVEEGEVMEKTASYDGPITEFLSNLKRERGYLYALVNALTAGEYYGPNRNGDFFPEDALKKYHKTFEQYGHVYKNHVNKDPKKSMGKVLFSHYNPRMKRVEVVVRLEKKHPDVVNIRKGISDGMLPKVSMGCKVPFDVCSITGKKAKTRADYSEYLLTQMGQILPDGRRVCAINTRPRFFDLSIVVIPADPVAAFMATFDPEGNQLKLATDKLETKEAVITRDIEIGEMDKAASWEEGNKMSAFDKGGEITKNLPAQMENIEDDPSALIKNTTPRLEQEEIEKLSQYPLNEVLSTFMGLRILPHKEDFQKLALYCAGEKQLADELEKAGQFFTINETAEELDDVGINYMNEKVANEILGNISRYSLTKPFIINRILEKSASLSDPLKSIMPNNKEVERSFIKKLLIDEEPEPASSGVHNPIAAFTTLGALYAGYARLFGRSAKSSEFMKMVSKNPWIAPGLGAGLALGVTKMQERILKDQPLNKQAAKIGPMMGSMLVGVPLTYYASAKNELKARKGYGLSNTEDFIRKHPLIAGLTASAGAGLMFKGMGNSVGKVTSSVKKKNPLEPSGFFGKKKTAGLQPETINLIFKEITTS